MTKVGVLGSTGMLGTTLSEVLRQENFQVVEFNRRGFSSKEYQHAKQFIVDEGIHSSNLDVLNECDVVINALGLIRQVIDEDDEHCVLQAHLVNSFFPMLLNEFALKFNVPVIQIGTDCVFSGTSGGYLEKSEQHYTDLYAFTKYVGENFSLSTDILRTSIIGREANSRVSLLSWVLGQENNARIFGYRDHRWNGLTSLHFSKIAIGIIRASNFQGGIRHVVPADIVTKEELVRSIAENFGRNDIEVVSIESGKPIDRSLGTESESNNLQLWLDAGYNRPLTIEEMIVEYAEWEKSTYPRKKY
jgi:dTDP-4-dehydrorhamnose reductase